MSEIEIDEKAPMQPTTAPTSTPIAADTENDADNGQEIKEVSDRELALVDLKRCRRCRKVYEKNRTNFFKVGTSRAGQIRFDSYCILCRLDYKTTKRNAKKRYEKHRPMLFALSEDNARELLRQREARLRVPRPPPRIIRMRRSRLLTPPRAELDLRTESTYGLEV